MMVPTHDHKIRPAGSRFELVTHNGYVLCAFNTVDEAQAYYAWHCPTDTFIQEQVAATKKRQKEERARLEMKRSA